MRAAERMALQRGAEAPVRMREVSDVWELS